MDLTAHQRQRVSETGATVLARNATDHTCLAVWEEDGHRIVRRIPPHGSTRSSGEKTAIQLKPDLAVFSRLQAA